MKTYKFTINGNKYSVDVSDVEGNKATVVLNGTSYEVELEDVPVAPPAPKPVIKVTTSATQKAAPATTSVPQAAPAKSNVGKILIKTPLPGAVIDVYVKVGDAVKAGQRVALLEAMKMENNIDAEKDGVVTEIRVQPGDTVLEDDVLIVME